MVADAQEMNADTQEMDADTLEMDCDTLEMVSDTQEIEKPLCQLSLTSPLKGENKISRKPFEELG